MEVERKIRKIGNSSGVLLPSEMLKTLGVDAEDNSVVYVRLEENEIVISKNKKELSDNDNFKEKVLAIVEEYMENRKEEPK